MTTSLRPTHVSALTLARLCERVEDLHLAAGNATVPVTGASLDTRSVQRGDIYIALQGARAHGAKFASQAVAAGAAAVLTDAAGQKLLTDLSVPVLLAEDPRRIAGEVAAQIYGDASQKLSVIGITGTNGKTTTAHLLNSVLQHRGVRTALLGTAGTVIDGEAFASARTTPEAPDLQALLAYALERGVEALVMEVSSHAMSLHRVAGVHFAAVGFTNLSPDHLDFHADMEEYFSAKAQLFDGRAAREFIVVDDEAGQRLAELREAADTLTMRDNADARWHVASKRDGFGARFQIRDRNGDAAEGHTALPGAFNVANAALAAVMSTVCGIALPDATAMMESVPGVPGRMERVRDGYGEQILAVVDYAHAPDGVEQALCAVRENSDGRVICVLGCGGDRDTLKRPLMGAAAARGADVFIATDDNPRSEDPDVIRAQMLTGVEDVPDELRAQVREVGSRAEAIRVGVELAKPGDVVAVLGKGHEKGQEIDGVTHPFLDRNVLAEVLGAVHEVRGNSTHT